MTKEQIEETLEELSTAVYNVANDLAHIDNITEALLPNPGSDEDDADSGITSEQYDRYMSLMHSLRWHICVEFRDMVKEEVLKEYKIR